MPDNKTSEIQLLDRVYIHCVW